MTKTRRTFPTELIKKLYSFYYGEINGDELKNYFLEWIKKNNYSLPKETMNKNEELNV